MRIHKVQVNAAAQRLDKPFLMVHIAQVDHFGLYLYLCEGAVARHRHVTQDELFYVHTGLLSLDTDWGRQGVSQGEFAVVPRGLSHLSGSIERTIVMLSQATSDPNRKNGQGRTAAESRDDGLPKWSVFREAERLPQAYLPVALAQVDEMSVRVVWCEGETPWHTHPHHDEMLFVQSGHMAIESEMGPVVAGASELVVIPRDGRHRLTASQRTIAVSLIHAEVSDRAHMGQ